MQSEKKLNFADEKEFDYDFIYSENVSNFEIFNKSIQDNIIKSLDGYNLSIMAYGQTVDIFIFYFFFKKLFYFILFFRHLEKLIQLELIIKSIIIIIIIIIIIKLNKKEFYRSRLILFLIQLPRRKIRVKKGA